MSSITNGLYGRYQKLKRPVYDPIDMSGIQGLQKRIKEANARAANPLGAPGVQQQLNTISEGLNRQFESEKGNVMSRAAQSGQAGFGGAFAQTSAGLSGALASTRAKTQADVMTDVFNRAQAEGMEATSALTAANSDVARIQNERSRIDADLSAQEAELYQRYLEQQARDKLDRDRMVEDTRRFTLTDRRAEEDQRYRRDQDALSTGFARRAEERQARLDQLSVTDRRRAEKRQEQLDEEARKQQGFQNDLTRANLGNAFDEDEQDPAGMGELFGRLGVPWRNKPLKWRKEDLLGGGGGGMKFRRRRPQ